MFSSVAANSGAGFALVKSRRVVVCQRSTFKVAVNPEHLMVLLVLFVFAATFPSLSGERFDDVQRRLFGRGIRQPSAV